MPIRLGRDFKIVPKATMKKYDWDMILDGKKRFFVAGKDFTCQLRNFSSQCRQNAERRGIGVDLQEFPGRKGHPRYGNGVAVQAVDDTSHHKRRVAEGGIGNAGGTPRRRKGYSSKKRMDPRKHDSQY